MSDVKISALPAVTSVATTDVIPVVTGGVTSKIGSANFVNSGLSSGTANGVLYLNGSKQATSGSALTFDGTKLGIGTSSPGAKLEVIGGNIKTDPFTRWIGYWEADTVHDGYLVPYNATGFTEIVNSASSGGLLFKTGTSKLERARISSDGTFRVKGAGTAGSTDAVQFSGSAPASSMSLDSYGNLHIPGGGGISTNEAFGTGALQSNTTGNYNTASGRDALLSNTTGSYNTASGRNALLSNTTGSSNTASGVNALFSNLTGSSNTASGRDALFSNTTGSNNTASGLNALYNSGKTVTAGSFVVGVSYTIQSIGTTDFTLIGAASNTVGLTFTTTGVGTGTGTASSNTNSNSAFGYQSLYANTTGNYNTASGAGALQSNTTGSNNTASGVDALFSNLTGSYNTASGAGALQRNTTGSYNTTNGYAALYNNATGINNTASGYVALQFNITGNSNTAIGSYALRNSGKTVTAGSFVIGVTYTIQSIGTTDFTLIGAASNTIGVVFTTTGVGTGTGTASSNTDNNSAFGYQALLSNTTGSSNTASGQNALYSNTTGNNNTASGYSALYGNTTGINNTGVGTTAGQGITTGSGNTCISPRTSTNTYSPVFNPTTENDRFCMGSTAVTNAYIQVAWTVVSDLRDKLLLGDVPHGLDFVTKLKPIKYQFKESRDSDIGHGPIKYGFGAQDVLALEGNDAVIVDTEVEDKLKITDSHLVPVLVKAIQELKAELDELKSQLGK